MHKNSKRDHKNLKIGLSDLTIKSSNPYVVACIPAFNEERSMGGVVVLAKRNYRVVDCGLWGRMFKKVDLDFQDGSHGDRRGD